MVWVLGPVTKLTELVLAVSDEDLLAQLTVDLNAEHFCSLSQDKEKQEAENEVKISRLDTENVEMEMKNVGEKTKRM